MTSLSIAALLNHVRLRYWLAVLFIALLSSSAYFSFSYMLNQNATSAAIINISGKQRMLSQRTALLTSQLVHASAQESSHLKKTLLETVSLMESDHQALIHGSKNLNIPEQHSEEIHQMYFGKMNIDSRLRAYINAIHNLIAAPTDELTPSNHNYQYIKSNYTPLLNDLNTIVNRYQYEGEKRVQDIKQMELWLWLTTLLILLLEIQFIFRPMSREIAANLNKRDDYEHQLEEQVKQQTQKLKKANQVLFELSNTDPLTGLKNRRAIEKQLAENHHNLERNKQHYSLAIIDIDHFKTLNDQYGHSCGDEVLKKLAVTLTYYLDQNSHIARWGGEEFLIVLPECNLQTAYQVLETLRQETEKNTLNCNNQKIKVTFSAGVASTEQHQYSSTQELFQQADLALYAAKADGRNQVKTATE